MKQSTQYLDPDILRQFLNLSAILAAFGINVLANIAPINGLFTSIGRAAPSQVEFKLL